MNAFYEEHLVKETLYQIDIHHFCSFICSPDHKLFDRVILIDLAEALWSKLSLVSVAVVDKFAFKCVVKDKLPDLSYDFKLFLQELVEFDKVDFPF